MAFSLFGARRNATFNQRPAPNPAPADDANKSGDQKPPADDADSKLVALAKLWQDPVNGANGGDQRPAGPQPLFNVDPAKVSEAVGKLNFASNVPKELLEKATNGDMSAMVEAMNIVAQTSFQASMLAVPGMVEPAVRKATGEVSGQLPGLIKNAQLASTRSENAAYNNEAVAPVVEALKSQVAKHNPQATPDQVMALVEQQLATLGNVLAPQRQQPEPGAGGRQQPAEQDFGFLL